MAELEPSSASSHRPATSPPEGRCAPLPLAGLRVLDVTNVLSGPFCTYQLALLGAEVVKVEPREGGDLARQLGADSALNDIKMGASFLAQNAGKKSLSLDLKAPKGREIFKRLAGRVDVLVENFRPGVMRRLGLDFETLSALNPGLVYCAISGFGQDGPIAQNPAYDQIVQGLSGVMSVTGDTASAPMRVGFPVCDTIGGLTAAFAIASALVGRAQSGRGRFIDLSMLNSTVVTLGWVVSNYLATGTTPVPMGNENMTAAPSGTFATATGLLNIAANKQGQFDTLCQVIGKPEVAKDQRFAAREDRKRNRHLLKQEIEVVLRTRPAAVWADLLNARGVPAGCVLTVPEALDSPQVRHRRLIQEFEGPGPLGHPVRVVRSGFRFGDAEPGTPIGPPRLGEHSDEILIDLGLSAQEIQQLRADGVV